MLALSVARAVHFAFAIQAIGALLFVYILDRPPALTGNTNDTRRPSAQRWLMMCAALSAAATIPSGFAWLVLQAAGMTGHSVLEAWHNGAVRLLLFKTHAGVVWWVRLAISVTLLIDLCLLAFLRRVPSKFAICIGLGLAIANFISAAWLSHAASDAGPYASLHLATHALHMLAVSLWLGGLIPLAILLSSTSDRDTETVGHAATVTFGNIALAAVCLIVLSGIANTALMVNDLSDLTTGDYAALLAVKLVLLLLMLVLATMNRLQLVPRLATSNDGPATTRLWWSILGEVVLGLAILLAVGALGITAPGIDD
jgi:putative copper resistance protein D